MNGVAAAAQEYFGKDLDEVVHRSRVSYRIGDVRSPALPDTEALAAVMDELVAASRGERAPVTDGAESTRTAAIPGAVLRSPAKAKMTMARSGAASCRTRT